MKINSILFYRCSMLNVLSNVFLVGVQVLQFFLVWFYGYYFFFNVFHTAIGAQILFNTLFFHWDSFLSLSLLDCIRRQQLPTSCSILKMCVDKIITTRIQVICSSAELSVLEGCKCYNLSYPVHYGRKLKIISDCVLKSTSFWFLTGFTINHNTR